jgi:hypothetical protein
MHAWAGLQHVSFSLSHYMKKPASFFACIYVTTHMYLHMYFPFFYMLGSTHGQGCTYGFDSDKNPSNTHMAAYLCRCCGWPRPAAPLPPCTLRQRPPCSFKARTGLKDLPTKSGQWHRSLRRWWRVFARLTSLVDASGFRSVWPLHSFASHQAFASCCLGTRERPATLSRSRSP